MFYIDETKCAGCGKCIKNCQQGAINFVNQKASINNKLCNECGMCYEICPNGAVVEVSKSSQTNIENTGGIVTALAGMFQVVYDLFASRAQNRVSTKRGQYNQCGNRRGRGLGQRRRGRGKGRF